ncbi:MAG: hypothetical protein ACRDZ3_01215 [Acidimicrobiia bacterium]
MGRKVLMVGLAAMAAAVLPVPALADDPGPTDRSRSEALAAAPEIPSALVPCSQTPAPAAGESAPVGPGPCPGVRPGGRVVSTIADCTLNFLFKAPDGTRYIGTAGHCVELGHETTFKDSDNDGNGRVERVWAWGNGPLAMDSTGVRFGEFVYAVKYDPKDFALIRLDPGVPASPEMCHFGAPRGVSTTATADTGGAVVLRYYGNAEGVGDVTPARSAVAMGTPNPDHIYAAGLALPGDSGAGVMTADGLAIGVLVSTGYQLPAPSEFPQANEKGVDVGTMGITTLGPQLARAAEKLGVVLELVTAE